MALAGGGKSFNLQKVQKSTVFSIIKLYVQRRKKKKKKLPMRVTAQELKPTIRQICS